MNTRETKTVGNLKSSSSVRTVTSEFDRALDYQMAMIFLSNTIRKSQHRPESLTRVECSRLWNPIAQRVKRTTHPNTINVSIDISE